MLRLREGKPCRQKRGKIPIYSCFWTKGSSNLIDVVNIKSLNTGASLLCLHLAQDLTASSTPLTYDERYLKAIFMSLHKNTSYYSCCAFQQRFTHLSSTHRGLNRWQPTLDNRDHVCLFRKIRWHGLHVSSTENHLRRLCKVRLLFFV